MNILDFAGCLLIRGGLFQLGGAGGDLKRGTFLDFGHFFLVGFRSLRFFDEDKDFACWCSLCLL